VTAAVVSVEEVRQAVAELRETTSSRYEDIKLWQSAADEKFAETKAWREHFGPRIETIEKNTGQLGELTELMREAAGAGKLLCRMAACVRFVGHYIILPAAVVVAFFYIVIVGKPPSWMTELRNLFL